MTDRRAGCRFIGNGDETGRPVVSDGLEFRRMGNFAVGIDQSRLDRGKYSDIPGRRLAPVEHEINENSFEFTLQVNINPLYMKRELHHCLEKVDAKMLIALECHPNQNYYQLLTNIVPEITQQPYGKPVTTRHLPHLEYIVMNTEKNLP